MILNETHYGRMESVVSRVKEFFESINVEVPFYVAGGSMFSAVTNTNYEDIDVFFYNKDHLQKVLTKVGRDDKDVFFNYNKNKQVFVEYISENAISLTNKIQLISKDFGMPKDVMNGFDFNCCMLAMDDTYIPYVDERFSMNMEFIEENFKSQTLHRYKKYTIRKNANDHDLKCIKSIIDYIIEHKDDEVHAYYHDTQHNVLHTLSISKFSNSLNGYFDNKVCEIYTDEHDRINIFKRVQNILMADTDDMCDEHKLARLLSDTVSNQHTLQKEERLRIKIKYAEFFI